jgi:hypothetical protein
LKLTQWTLFIDMLGYREINGNINSEEKAKEFIAFMELNRKIFEFTDSEDIKAKYAKDEFFNLYKYYDIQSAFVSDSLIITYHPKEVDEVLPTGIPSMHSANALFIIAMRLQTFIFNCFSEKGIFLRGGISNKYCYIKNNFAVGEGLIEAYLGESKYANNPRIVLHPALENNAELMEKIEFISKKMYSGRSLIQKDADDLYFLDHLGYAITTIDTDIPMISALARTKPIHYASLCKSVSDYTRRHADAISRKFSDLNEKLSQLAPESEEAKVIKSVISKFIWLKNYHNSKIDKHELLSKYKIA